MRYVGVKDQLVGRRSRGIGRGRAHRRPVCGDGPVLIWAANPGVGAVASIRECPTGIVSSVSSAVDDDLQWQSRSARHFLIVNVNISHRESSTAGPRALSSIVRANLNIVGGDLFTTSAVGVELNGAVVSDVGGKREVAFAQVLPGRTRGHQDDIGSNAEI